MKLINRINIEMNRDKINIVFSIAYFFILLMHIVKYKKGTIKIKYQCSFKNIIKYLILSGICCSGIKLTILKENRRLINKEIKLIKIRINKLILDILFKNLLLNIFQSFLFYFIFCKYSSILFIDSVYASI
ncbi:MAG: hypothetical protein AMJ78_00730 [Omnitrophica WOR_2 bacterium SM23_29]|nr:MAG: hypothetical protein AMJ78_00730 [Omnitrophica WOR_2 bacterium SM23_29]